MPTAQPGDVKFADLNGDGVIDDKDKTNIGDPNPDIIFGLNFSFGYKGFDLNITTNGVLGNQIFYNFHGNPTEIIAQKSWEDGMEKELPIKFHGLRMVPISTADICQTCTFITGITGGSAT